MAKINTYAVATPAIDDELLGTDISDTGNDANGETAQFTVQALRDLMVKGVGQCYLEYTSTTVLTLKRKNGRFIQIAGELHEIPAAGTTLGTSGLSVSTLYYIYAYDNSGTLTMEASTTAWTVSTTAGNEGMPIKTGDNTRTFVGMTTTNNPVAFNSSWHASYWNPVRRFASATETSQITTTSLSWTAIGTPVYFPYITGHPFPRVTIVTPLAGSAVGVSTFLAAYLSGTSAISYSAAQGSRYSSATVGGVFLPLQGIPYVRAFGLVNTGTGYYGISGSLYMQSEVEFWG